MTKILLSAIGYMLVFVLFVGDIYWFWLAWQFGSFWMFALGVTPLTPATAVIGAYAFVFGTPDWVVNFFG